MAMYGKYLQVNILFIAREMYFSYSTKNKQRKIIFAQSHNQLKRLTENCTPSVFDEKQCDVHVR